MMTGGAGEGACRVTTGRYFIDLVAAPESAHPDPALYPYPAAPSPPAESGPAAPAPQGRVKAVAAAAATKAGGGAFKERGRGR
jgi:hypothetical protein